MDRPTEEQCEMMMRRVLFCPSQERTIRELDAMDTVTRQQVWADMTGYSAIEQTRTSVTQEFLNHKLLELTMFLQQSGLQGRDAYDTAVRQDPHWMEQEKLKFLRAFNFDIPSTADHMLRCFTLKEELFGRDKLSRDICLSDLNEDDMASLETEPLYLLPRKDHAGRAVFFTRSSAFAYKERCNAVSYRNGNYESSHCSLITE